MYYISSCKYFGTEKKYGVTDTKDGVEEFYTIEDLSTIFHKYRLRIKGMVYTGSSFKFYIKTPDMLILDGLEKGKTFNIQLPYKNKVRALYVGASGDDNYLYFTLESKDVHKLTTQFLMDNKGCVSVGADDELQVELRKQYKLLYPTSHLSRFL